MLEKNYIETLAKRKKTTHVFKDFQHIGLVIAQMLGDDKHKTLYIKLAKFANKQTLMSLAKDVAERSAVSNKGAYFVKILKEKGLFAGLKEKKSWLKKKTLKSGHSKERVRHLF